METGFSKEKLLDMRVTEFNLGYKFDKYFLRFPGQKKFWRLVEPLEPAMTLREFFEKNKTAHTKKRQQFICAADGTGFTSTSVAFKHLVEFLKKNGFDEFDWRFLSTGRQTNLFPFTVLKDQKETLLPLDISLTCKVVTRASTFTLLKQALSLTTNTVTVGQVLGLTRKQVESVTGTFHNWKLDYSQVQMFRAFIKRLQKQFTEFGFSEKDGPFMTILFKREIVDKTKPQYPHGLCEVQNLPIPGKKLYYPKEKWVRLFGDPLEHFGGERWFGSVKWFEMEEERKMFGKTG